MFIPQWMSCVGRPHFGKSWARTTLRILPALTSSHFIILSFPCRNILQCFKLVTYWFSEHIHTYNPYLNAVCIRAQWIPYEISLLPVSAFHTHEPRTMNWVGTNNLCYSLWPSWHWQSGLVFENCFQFKFRFKGVMLHLVNYRYCFEISTHENVPSNCYKYPVSVHILSLWS